MKKKVFFLAVILVLVIAGMSLRNNNVSFIIKRARLNSVVDYTVLKYRIYILGLFPVGEIMLNKPVEADFMGKQVFRLHAFARTFDYLSKIYQADATLDSYIDKASSVPLFFREELIAKGKKSVKEVSYDQKKLVMKIEGVERKILPSTYDPLSLMHKLIKTDLAATKEIKMYINSNQKNYVFVAGLIYSGSKIMNEQNNIFTIDGKIKRVDKNPYHQTSLTIKFLKKDENIPLLIRVFAGGMLVTARLTEVK